MRDHGPLPVGKAFAYLMRDYEPLPYLGDLMFWWLLQPLIAAPLPALEISETHREWLHRHLTLTELGQAVPEGHRSWQELAPAERWWVGYGFRQVSQPRSVMSTSGFHLAARLDDLRVPPGNRLHALSGDRAGQYAISINAQWRICFRFEDGDAYDVEVCDYH